MEPLTDETTIELPFSAVTESGKLITATISANENFADFIANEELMFRITKKHLLAILSIMTP